MQDHSAVHRLNVSTLLWSCQLYQPQCPVTSISIVAYGLMLLRQADQGDHMEL